MLKLKDDDSAAEEKIKFNQSGPLNSKMKNNISFLLWIKSLITIIIIDIIIINKNLIYNNIRHSTII